MLACSQACSSVVSVFLRASLAAVSLKPAMALVTESVTFSVAHQHVRELRGAALFGASIRRGEAELHQALVLGGEFREAGFDAMVIGEHQTLG